MPEIGLFVVSIASIQQQGIYLSDEVQTVMPELISKVLEKTEISSLSV
jgi:hypothetical protein